MRDVTSVKRDLKVMGISLLFLENLYRTISLRNKYKGCKNEKEN